AIRVSKNADYKDVSNGIFLSYTGINGINVRIVQFTYTTVAVHKWTVAGPYYAYEEGSVEVGGKTFKYTTDFDKPKLDLDGPDELKPPYYDDHGVGGRVEEKGDPTSKGESWVYDSPLSTRTLKTISAKYAGVPADKTLLDVTDITVVKHYDTYFVLNHHAF